MDKNMVNICAIGVTLLVMLGWATPRADAAGKEQRHVTWEGLAVVVAHKVKVIMPDGARIEGKAMAVETDALVVEIRKSSNPAAYPKGKFLVPRATLRAVDVDHPTWQWRIVGVAVGGTLGALVGVLAVAAGKSNPGIGTGIGAGAVGVVVAGYLMGRAADRRTITYVIAP